MSAEAGDARAVRETTADAGSETGITGLCELALWTDDRATLERFYVDVIGLPVIAREDDRTWLAVGPRGRLGLWRPGRKEFGDQGGAHVHFAMSVSPSGLDDLVARLRAAGVDHEGPVEHEGGDRSAYWTDPEGNVGEAWDYFDARHTVDDL